MNNINEKQKMISAEKLVKVSSVYNKELLEKLSQGDRIKLLRHIHLNKIGY